MSEWKSTLHFEDFWDNADMDTEAKAKKAARRIRVLMDKIPGMPWSYDGEDFDTLEELATRFEDEVTADDTAEFNSILADLYDWGDELTLNYAVPGSYIQRKKCWIATFPMGAA